MARVAAQAEAKAGPADQGCVLFFDECEPLNIQI
jgi:hypothetical protein